MDVCFAVYYRANDDVFETFLNTFRIVAPNKVLVVYTDISEDEQSLFVKKYDVKFVFLVKDKIKNRRCLCKMECLSELISGLGDDDRVLVSDVDTYYLDDPFAAFDKCSFDVGVTRRLHSYKYPVNSGVFFIRVNALTRNIFGLEFSEYAKGYINKDWMIDQDFMNHLWADGRAVDVGWEYNFCPNTDLFGVLLASDMIKRAYESRSVRVLHLKSELKMCIYDGFLKDAIAKRRSDSWNWEKNVR